MPESINCLAEPFPLKEHRRRKWPRRCFHNGCDFLDRFCIDSFNHIYDVAVEQTATRRVISLIHPPRHFISFIRQIEIPPVTHRPPSLRLGAMHLCLCKRIRQDLSNAAPIPRYGFSGRWMSFFSDYVRCRCCPSSRIEKSARIVGDTLAESRLSGRRDTLLFRSFPLLTCDTLSKSVAQTYYSASVLPLKPSIISA